MRRKTNNTKNGRQWGEGLTVADANVRSQQNPPYYSLSTPNMFSMHVLDVGVWYIGWPTTPCTPPPRL